MLALATALSFCKLWEMPMGGSVTLGSMLPIFLFAIKYGPKKGVVVSFLYAGIQVAQAFIEGNVFVYCETAVPFLVVLFFDYLIPFTALGLVFSLPKLCPEKFPRLGYYISIVTLTVVRFLCHLLSGATVWSQWTDMNPWLYSFLYNGTFLLPELAITLVMAILLLETPVIRKNLDIA